MRLHFPLPITTIFRARRNRLDPLMSAHLCRDIGCAEHGQVSPANALTTTCRNGWL